LSNFWPSGKIKHRLPFFIVFRRTHILLNFDKPFFLKAVSVKIFFRQKQSVSTLKLFVTLKSLPLFGQLIHLSYAAKPSVAPVYFTGVDDRHARRIRAKAYGCLLNN
jgi:hypothetical protein